MRSFVLFTTAQSIIANCVRYWTRSSSFLSQLAASRDFIYPNHGFHIVHIFLLPDSGHLQLFSQILCCHILHILHCYCEHGDVVTNQILRSRVRTIARIRPCGLGLGKEANTVSAGQQAANHESKLHYLTLNFSPTQCGVTCQVCLCDGSNHTGAGCWRKRDWLLSSICGAARSIFLSSWYNFREHGTKAIGE
jgi:hypothetical protein